MKKKTALKGPELIYREFWDWFVKHEKKFFAVVMNGEDAEEKFLDYLGPKLSLLGGKFYFLTGLWDANSVELTITADGDAKYMVFVEELVASAPKLKGWKFIAHKPAIDHVRINIEIAGFQFNGDNLSFYPVVHRHHPDEIDIRVVYHNFTEKNKGKQEQGAFIFLDNILGELISVTAVDSVRVIGKREAVEELIPIEKLKSFLIWRQKEFVEKNEGIRYETAKDDYVIIEALTKNDKPVIGVVNTDLINWDSKASHPWILRIEISYSIGKKNGMPDDKTYNELETFEKTLLGELKDREGNLYLGRFTAQGTRQIYFACKDFRQPAKVMHCIDQSTLNTSFMFFDIYLDKYWRSFTHVIDGKPAVD